MSIKLIAESLPVAAPTEVKDISSQIKAHQKETRGLTTIPLYSAGKKDTMTEPKLIESETMLKIPI